MMSMILKPKHRTKLYAVVAIAVIGGGLFMFYGGDMEGIANAVFNFKDTDGDAVPDQCAMTASLGAYDRDGNLIKDKTLQSGFYIGGSEIAYIEFEISMTIKGTNIDWANTPGGGSDSIKLFLHPTGGEKIDTGWNLLTSMNGEQTEMPQPDFEMDITVLYTIWDADYAPQQEETIPVNTTETVHEVRPIEPTDPAYNDNWFIQDAIGEPVSTAEDGSKVYLLQMSWYVELSVSDFAGNVLTASAVAIGTWELNTLDTVGSLEIIINEGIGDIDDGDLEVLDEYIIPDGEIEIGHDTDIIVDGDKQPDVTIIADVTLKS